MDVSHTKWFDCIEKCWWLKCGIKRKEKWVLKLTSVLWGHWGTERTGLREAHPHHACVGTLNVRLETNISNQREWTAWWPGSRMNSARFLHQFFILLRVNPAITPEKAFFSSSFYTSWMFYIKRLAKKKSNIWWCWTGHRDHLCSAKMLLWAPWWKYHNK